MGGMTYTMTDTTKLSTAECYGIALCELGEEHKDVVALTADLAKSTKIGMSSLRLDKSGIIRAITFNL